MKILITSYGNSISKNISDSLIKNNKIRKIFCFNRKLSRSFKNVKLIKLNILNKKQLEFFLKKNNFFDIIIHTAFVTANNNNLDSYRAFQKNLKITENLIFFLKKIKFKKLINFSSISVYPRLNDRFKENSKIDPSVNIDALYGLAKFNSEMLFNYYFNVKKIINLRIANVVNIKNIQKGIFYKFCCDLKKNNKIIIYGNGKKLFNFIYENELVKIINFLISKKIYGTFNVNKYTLTYNNLAKKIISLFGNKKSVIIKRNIINNNSLFRIDSKNFLKLYK
jgi:nucleoside-diphosphate-sugar epimerase